MATAIYPYLTAPESLVAPQPGVLDRVDGMVLFAPVDVFVDLNQPVWSQP